MMKWRLGHLLSVALAPIVGFLPFTTVAGIGATPAVAQETSPPSSCFTGIDYSQLSFSELQALVAQAVSQLDPGLSDDDIALEIGRQIGESAGNCSPAQLQALAQNVAIILADLGVEPTGEFTVAELVLAAIAPSTAATEVTDGEITSLASVY